MIATIYTQIITFVQRAANWYSEGKIKRALASIARSYTLQFEDLAEEISKSSRILHEEATRLSMAGRREMQSNMFRIVAEMSYKETKAPADSDADSKSFVDDDSVFSLDRSLSSQTSVASQEVGSYFTQELVQLLFEDPVLQPLYIVALRSDQIGKERFQNNFRRLLMQYAEDIKQEAQTNEHRAVGGFVSRRLTIVSKEICSRISGQDDEERFYHLEKMAEKDDSRLKVERYLRSSSQSNGDIPDSDDDSIDEIFADEQYDESLTELSRVKRFMLTSFAFQSLCKNLHDFVYPSFRSRLYNLVNAWSRLGNIRNLVTTSEAGRSSPPRVVR